MTTIQDDIKKLQEDSYQMTSEAVRLSRLMKEVPDLKKYVGRWNKVAYYSATANSQATDYDMRHNCGCCNDSPLEIWPYMETPFGKVYSDPPKFTVGERHWISGDQPYPNWKKELQDASIPEIIIDQIACHFQSDKELRIKYAAEDGEGYSEND